MCWGVGATGALWCVIGCREEEEEEEKEEEEGRRSCECQEGGIDNESQRVSE